MIPFFFSSAKSVATKQLPSTADHLHTFQEHNFADLVGMTTYLRGQLHYKHQKEPIITKKLPVSIVSMVKMDKLFGLGLYRNSTNMHLHSIYYKCIELSIFLFLYDTFVKYF